MNGFLETILARKREEVAEAKKRTPAVQLRERRLFSVPRRSLRAALSAEGLAVIAEIKKASPSKGMIRKSFDHREIADQYVRGGANALSVLTDEDFFQGSLSFLEDLRQRVTLPLLRKDFIIDSYQLVESKASGADAVLLIAAALDPFRLADLHHEAKELGLECVVEVHSEKEIDLLAGIKGVIIGVNNRDLATFHTDLGTSLRLRPLLPPDALTVSESGINSAADVRVLADHGYHAVLIGEMLMKSADPGEALRHLKEEATKK